VDWLVEAKDSEKRAVYIFRVEAKIEIVSFSETSPSTNRSTRRLKPKEQHQNFHRRENLKSHAANPALFGTA
jgi:hypothetical protein